MGHGDRVIFRNSNVLVVDAFIEVRVLQMADLDTHYALINANRDHIGRYESWGRVTSRSDQRLWIEACMTRQRDNTGFAGGIWSRPTTGESHRYAGAISGVYENNRAELGYWLGADFTGKGTMMRVLRAVSKSVLATGYCQQVQLRIMAENRGSRAVAERAGFRLRTWETRNRALYVWP
jgi:ribosomal-protein-serine acetyltransferase